MSVTGRRYEVQASKISIAGFDDPAACKAFAAQLLDRYRKGFIRRAEFVPQAIDTTTGQPIP